MKTSKSKPLVPKVVLVKFFGCNSITCGFHFSFGRRPAVCGKLRQSCGFRPFGQQGRLLNRVFTGYRAAKRVESLSPPPFTSPVGTTCYSLYVGPQQISLLCRGCTEIRLQTSSAYLLPPLPYYRTST